MLSCSFIFEWSLLSVALSIHDKINKRQRSSDWWSKMLPKNTLLFQAQAATSSITVWYYVQHRCVQHNEYYLFYIDSIVLPCVSRTISMTPWTMPSWWSTISKKEDWFYIIFVLYIFIFILYWVYSWATTCSPELHPACRFIQVRII